MKTSIKRLMAMVLLLINVCTMSLTVGAYGVNTNGTATKKVTAYRLPSVNSGDIWWVDKNDPLEVFCKDGDYYLVLYPFNRTGLHVIAYLPTSVVQVTGVPEANMFYKNDVVRTNSDAILYHNPSTNALIGASGSNQTVRTTVSKGQELTVLFEKDGFYCVRTSNDTGFIEKNKICTHSNTSKQKTSSSNVININDESYHEVKITYKEVCNACGIITKENISETEREKHSISTNKCTKCGYEVPMVEEKCNHSNTKEKWQSSTISQKNDTHHTVEEIYDVLCVDCGETLKKSQKGTYDEKHSLKNDDCEKCSYVVPGSEASICKHKNTTKHSSEDMKTTISIKDDKQHSIASYYHIYCSDCYTYVSENELELIHEDHKYVNDVCSVCNMDKPVALPDATTLKVGKSSYVPGEEISLSWGVAIGATTYDVHIYKEDQASRYRLDSGFTGTSCSIKINDEGTYSLRIYSINSAGYTDGNAVTVTVKKAFTEKTAWVCTTGTSTLRLREGAGTSFSTLAFMKRNEAVTVTGDLVNGFYPIRYGNKNGYGSAEWLSFTKPIESPQTNVTSNSKTAQIQSKLSGMMNGTTHSGTYKIGKKYTGPYYTEQCKGFAKSVFQQLFGYNIGSTTNGGYGYEINYSSAKTTHLGTVTSMTTANIKNLFLKARPGDFVQMKQNYNTYKGPHSGIVYDVSADGVTIFEANLDNKNTISKNYYSWSQLCSCKSAMSVYTAKGY